MSERIGRPEVGVGVFIFRAGKFLIGRRLGAHGAESWSLPGGKLEFNEEIEEAASREVMEETNCDITNVRIAAVTNDIFPEADKHFVTVWTTSDWRGGEPTVTEPDKFVDLGWVDFDTLPQPLFSPMERLMSSEFYETLRGKLAATAMKGVNDEI